MDINEIISSPITWIVFGATSEIIAQIPWLKSNSWTQLLLSAIRSLQPKKG